MAKPDRDAPTTPAAGVPFIGRLRKSLLPEGWKPSAGLGLVAGAGFVGAYPPVGLWPLVILPVWAAIQAADPRDPGAGSTGVRRSALWFGIGTIPAWAWLTRWAASGAAAGYPLLVLYLAAFMAIAVWFMSRARRAFPRVPALVTLPVAWAGAEAFRGLLAFNGFPWYLAEYPLIDATIAGVPILAWPARVGGVWLVALVLAVFTVLVVRALRAERPIRPFAVASAFLATWLGLAFVAAPVPNRDTITTAAVVQTNVPQSIKTGWSFDDRWRDWLELRRMLVAAAMPQSGAQQAPARPDFIVIPETMFPGFVLQDDAAEIERASGVGWRLERDPDGPRSMRAETIRDELIGISNRLGVPILIGATRFDGFRIERDGPSMFYRHDARYNSVFLLDNGAVSALSYDKQELTPFGEVMPYISAWPAIERVFLSVAARGMSFDLAAGTRPTVFPIDAHGASEPVRLVTPICYEATVGGVCRGLVFDGDGRRADVLINMTNDGWFYDAAGGRQMHLLTARWRALELDTAMVRSANSGVSAIIGPAGRVLGSLEPHEAGVLVAGVPGPGGETLYARLGDGVGWICALVAIFGVAVSYIPMLSNRAGGRAEPRNETPHEARHDAPHEAKQTGNTA